MYDWKRSRKIVNPENPPTIITKAWGKTGIGGLSHVDDTSYNRYKIQQSLYKYILEKNYNIEINRMFLVVIHPVYDTYYKLSVPEMREEAEYILESL